jgi:S1-C subfamily serine protease
MQWLLLIILSLPLNAIANVWDDVRFQNLPAGRQYKILIGSGFFVNQDTIVTNKHVVENCTNIAIRGAVAPTLAKLIIIDKQMDIAVLTSPLFSQRVPYLRNNHDEIKIGDILFSIGYPLERGKTGEFIVIPAKVLKTKTDLTSGFEDIEFSDNVNHGNSGGPLLDKNSNLVGIVTAKLTYKYKDSRTPSRHAALAIGVEGLIDFLKKNNINYASSSSYDIFTNYHVDKLAKDYVVNIHCIK